MNKDENYYIENGFIVFTEKHHINRGYCCGSGCRHCPYSPKHKQGATETATKQKSGKKR